MKRREGEHQVYGQLDPSRRFTTPQERTPFESGSNQVDADVWSMGMTLYQLLVGPEAPGTGVSKRPPGGTSSLKT